MISVSSLALIMDGTVTPGPAVPSHQQHPRDQCITFDDKEHKYTISHPLWLQRVADGTGTVSVTTMIHQLFPKFDGLAVATRMVENITRKYQAWLSAGANAAATGEQPPPAPSYTVKETSYVGMTVPQILAAWEANGEHASNLGTCFHQQVEDYLSGRGPPPVITQEFSYFLAFWRDFTARYPTLSVYRLEWMVYDEDIGLAGSIDAVLSDPQGNLVILDWKRSKEIELNNRYRQGFSVFEQFDDCNWSHYQLQLNIYREILERKYGKKIIAMMNVVCHPNQAGYLCYPVSHIDLHNHWSLLPDLGRQHSAGRH